MLKVEKNQNLDIDKFIFFFFKAGKRQLKEEMIKSYPSLKDITDENQIKRFVDELYEQNEKKIDSAIEELKEIVEDNDPELWAIIEELMNEKFDSEYFIYPTMLPISPYGKDHTYFNLSIMHNIFAEQKISIFETSRICSHELSHFLFYKKMRRLFSAETDEESAKKIGVSMRSFDGLKEIYALIIQNHPKMRKFFPNRIVGNREYRHITVKCDNHIMTIEDYFIEKYMDLEKIFNDRDKLDSEMIKLLKQIDKEFSDKLEIFNTVSDKLFTQKGLFNPIEV